MKYLYKSSNHSAFNMDYMIEWINLDEVDESHFQKDKTECSPMYVESISTHELKLGTVLMRTKDRQPWMIKELIDCFIFIIFWDYM